VNLAAIARRAMIEHGLEPDFPGNALRQVAALRGPATDAGARDLRALPWASIDNDDSRDLDQLTVAEELAGDRVRVLVAVADVDALVAKDSPVDGHAQRNTTSVYTAARIFPMLPERLSTDLTSLADQQERLALIVEYEVEADGTLASSDVYRARVVNHAKLAYPSVGAWLDGQGPMPPAMAAAPGVDAQIRLQDRVARTLCERRHEHGALDLEVIEPRPIVRDGNVVDLALQTHTRATQLIEDFMIAANGVMAEFLESHKLPVLRRIVREPERWPRIVEIALGLGDRLPPTPDSKALDAFLVRRRAADPLRFPDLSLTIIKLLGRGEYVASFPGQAVVGHFGLAVSEYTHSTAPNRRYPDLVTQRLVRAAMARKQVPYGKDELGALATECTLKEDGAQKVERLVRKAAAACLLASRIGQQFDGVVTGASAKGTWVRVFDPPVEGRVERGQEGLDVGDRVRVRLVHTNPERGFIDFVRL